MDNFIKRRHDNFDNENKKTLQMLRLSGKYIPIIIWQRKIHWYKISHSYILSGQYDHNLSKDFECLFFRFKKHRYFGKTISTK